MTTPVAIYARFSTDRQDARSIEDQVRRCRRYAAERDLAVVATYEDSAVSGATLARNGLHRLMTEARERRFKLVLVDDLSRLSRDLGDLFRLVFDEMVLAGVALLDCQTGMRSDQAGARMTFGAVGLAADAFLQMVRHETHRGLEGRALAGFHTGGRCYGYRTAPEENPPDPLHPRAVLVIDLAEAALVRRVFEAFDGGASPREIAAGLNREGTPAPYDGRGYSKPAGRGWSHNTIRSMLRNERYIGRITWNRREWNRAGARKRRVPRLRPVEEWVTKERPELTIIGSELWARVQARLGERRRGAGVPKRRDGTFSSALSGMLRCGTCGSRMTIYGCVKKAGRTYRNFACAANREKGPDICPNGLQISEAKALAALVATVRGSLAHPKFRERFEATLRRIWATAQADEEPGEADVLGRELRSLEGKRDRLVGLIEDGAGDVHALVERLRALESQIREVRARRATALELKPARRVIPFPDPGAVLGDFEDLEGALTADPTIAHAALEARFTPIVLTPRPSTEGVRYHLETTLKMNPAALAGGRHVPKVSGNVSCGGEMEGFSPTEKALYTRRMSAGNACSYPGCDRPLHGAGLCDGHRNQLRRGVPLAPLRPPRRKPKVA